MIKCADQVHSSSLRPFSFFFVLISYGFYFLFTISFYMSLLIALSFIVLKTMVIISSVNYSIDEEQWRTFYHPPPPMVSNWPPLILSYSKYDIEEK